MARTEMSLTPQVSNKEKHISWQILTGPTCCYKRAEPLGLSLPMLDVQIMTFFHCSLPHTLPQVWKWSVAHMLPLVANRKQDDANIQEPNMLFFKSFFLPVFGGPENLGW